MCAAAVPYKNGFRNFSYRRETTKLGGKRNTDAIITTPITADHHHQRGRERVELSFAVGSRTATAINALKIDCGAGFLSSILHDL